MFESVLEDGSGNESGSDGDDGVTSSKKKKRKGVQKDGKGANGQT